MARGRDTAERIARRVRALHPDLPDLDAGALLEQLKGSTVERAKKALAEARAQVGPGGSLRSDRMLRAPEVVKRTGMSRTTIWRLEREGKFPKRVQVSKNIVAWREREVAAWQDQKGRS